MPIEESQESGLELLKERVSELGLEPREAEILIHFATDENGLTIGKAPGLIAERIGYSRDEGLEAIAILLAEDLLIRESGNAGDAKIVVDWTRLNLPDRVREEVQSRRPRLLVQGNPLAQVAKERLAELYEDRRPLYLALGVTPPERFEGLEKRAERAARTVLLFPRKRDAGPIEHPRLYDENLASWQRWLQQGNRREHIELRITYRSYWFIRTSALSQDVVRFTVHSSKEAANLGELVEAGAGTSLYTVVERFYRDALLFSIPWWRLYRRRFLSACLARLAPLLLLVAVIVVSVLEPTALVIATGNAIIGLVSGGAARVWTARPELFKA